MKCGLSRVIFLKFPRTGDVEGQIEMSNSKAHYRDYGPIECKVYVGNLGEDASRHELWDAFQKYGDLRNVWVARNPAGFAFVEFVDERDAADAVKHLDNKIICNRRVVVELSSGESRKKYRGEGSSRGGGGGYGRMSGERCYECGRIGHFARDCTSRRGGGGRYSSRRYSRSRSRSYGRRSPSRSRSRSPRRSPSRSRSRSASPYRSPARNYDQN